MFLVVCVWGGSGVGGTGGHKGASYTVSTGVSYYLYPWNSRRTAGAFCAREALPDLRCQDVTTFARTPHPPLSLPPLSRSATRHKADEAVAKTRRRRDTWLCRYAHGWRDTAACERAGRVGGGGGRRGEAD
eukprot:scaffold16299_cov63-Phaeocystis_antarctica.AAC.7